MAGDQQYEALMVRLWTVKHNGDQLWRASVENVHTGERHAFADLAGLFDFLQAAVEGEPPAFNQEAGGPSTRSEDG